MSQIIFALPLISKVVDDESPWNYGFQFNVNNHEGTWNAVDDSLICVGM